MKKFALCLFLFFALADGFAQKIQYSRQTFPSPFADAMQLVANVGGYHHMLCFSANKKPLLYVFDAAMQSFVKKELQIKIKENCDVRTVAFGDRYLLYLHVPGTSVHQLSSIQSNGDSEDVSALFSRPADSAWNRSTSTFQLFNQSARLCVVTHTYYDEIKKIGSLVVTFDPTLTSCQTAKTFSSFDQSVDNLQQIILNGSHLLVLKSARNLESGNSLSVAKVNLVSGETLISSFNSGSHLYSTASMYYDTADSTLLIYSLMREPMNAARFQRSVFVVQLDHELQDKVPPALIKSQFRSNTAASFFLINGSQPRWLSTLNAIRIRKTGSQYSKPTGLYTDEPSTLNITEIQNFGYESGIEYNTPTAVRFTVLNEQFKSVEDSVVANSGNIYDVQPRPSAQFTIGKKPYLLLLQNFSAKQRGLLLFTNNEKGRMATISLPVFDRYEYMIPQTQTGKNFFILPYTYKNEIGLLKITLTD